LRLDKFLKVTKLIKRRTVAQEAAKEGFIYLNDKVAKPSNKLKEKDILVLDMWNYYKKVEIIKIPEKNNIPKDLIENYIKILEYRTKEVEY
jgi:ribosomal 50S subunit-recycling heat shock protein